MPPSLLALALLFVTLPALPDLELPASPMASAHPGVQSDRTWDLTLRFSAGYNDNVQLVPDSTTYYMFEDEPLGSNFLVVQADAVYRFVQTASTESGLTLSLSSLWNEQVLNSYNFYTINPGIFTHVSHNLSGLPATFSLAYDWRRENGHTSNLHALGLSSHNLRMSENVWVNPNTELNTALSLGFDNFEVKFPLTPSMVRDASRSALDFSLRYWMDSGPHNVMVGFGFVNNDSDGADFSYGAKNMSLRLESGALNPVWLAAEFRLSNRDYAPVTLARTEQRISTTLLQLLWPIQHHWKADVFYKYERYDSNDPGFETDVTQYGVGMSYSF